jgi:hypothetical protein
MTERLLRETRISLTKLAQEQGVSIPTVWRWSQRGNRGHVLETLSVGGRKFTTREAFSRWISRINGEPVVLGETPRQRERSIERAEQRAAAMGV